MGRHPDQKLGHYGFEASIHYEKHGCLDSNDDRGQLQLNQGNRLIPYVKLLQALPIRVVDDKAQYQAFLRKRSGTLSGMVQLITGCGYTILVS